MNDIDVMELARCLLLLEPLPPITQELDRWGSHYPSQKVHICEWLNSQAIVSKGAYGREKANSSAKAMYNRFLNPGGLLWIAEVLGERESILRAAADAAIKAERRDYRERCKAFRAVIKWERIMQLYSDYENWLYDPKLLPMIALDYKTQMPVIKEGYRLKFQKILEKEWNGEPKRAKTDY